jgi:hypothetical protein
VFNIKWIWQNTSLASNLNHSLVFHFGRRREELFTKLNSVIQVLTNSMALNNLWRVYICILNRSRHFPTLWDPLVHLRIYKWSPIDPVLSCRIQSTRSHSISLWSILILSSHLWLGIPSSPLLLRYVFHSCRNISFPPGMLHVTHISASFNQTSQQYQAITTSMRFLIM